MERGRRKAEKAFAEEEARKKNKKSVEDGQSGEVKQSEEPKLEKQTGDK